MKKHARLIGLLVLVVIGSVGTLYALPSVGHDTYYYATADQGGSPVGEDYRGCQNDHFTWGQVTQYVENNEWSCQNPDFQCYKEGWTYDWNTCYWSIDTCDDCADCTGPC